MLKLQAQIECNDCQKKESLYVVYSPILGYDVGKDWVNYTYSGHIKCLDCHDKATDRMDKKAEQMNWFSKKYFNWKLLKEYFYG